MNNNLVDYNFIKNYPATSIDIKTSLKEVEKIVRSIFNRLNVLFKTPNSFELHLLTIQHQNLKKREFRSRDASL